MGGDLRGCADLVGAHVLPTHDAVVSQRVVGVSFLSFTGFVQVLQKVSFHGEGIRLRSVSLDGLAIFVHDELGVVPFDGVHQESRLFRLEILPQRMGFIPVHVRLAEHVELHSILDASESVNLFIDVGLLAAELIAGECQNLQPFALAILLMQLDQFTVVAVG